MVGAVDIGGTKIAVGLVDEAGAIAAKEEFPTLGYQGFESAISRITRALERAIAETGCEIRGIGIGCTGPVDPQSGVLGNINFFPEWRGSNPVEGLAAEFNVPVAMENDADALALGEKECGAGKEKDSVVCITVGTGIGAGIILNGEVYRGVNGSHPELGHQIIDPAGPACTCGLTGCWESLASGPAMEAWFYENAPPELSECRPGAAEICALARQGNEWAKRCVERESRYLGIGIANVIASFLPQMVILGGGVMKSVDLFLAQIRAAVRGCQLIPSHLCEIEYAALGSEAGLIGAGQGWYHRFDRSRGSRE
jgi:glucokinase